MIRALTVVMIVLPVVMIVLPVVMYYKACMQSPSGLLCTIGKKAQPTYGHSPLQEDIDSRTNNANPRKLPKVRIALSQRLVAKGSERNAIADWNWSGCRRQFDAFPCCHR